MRRPSITVVAIAAAALLPAAALAQQDTTARDSTRQRGNEQVRQDTSRNRMDNQGRRQTSQQGRRIRSESAGSVETRGTRGNMGLTNMQVMMLQQALKEEGCDPGPADGIIGPRTRRAMACANTKNDLAGDDPNELLRALGLGFTVEQGMSGNARSQDGAMRDSTRMRDSTGMRDSTRMRDDSTGGRGTNGQRWRDSTGARDSTTNQNGTPTRDSTQAGQP